MVRYDPTPPHFNGTALLSQGLPTQFAGQNDHLLLSCPVCADNVSDVSLGTAVVSRYVGGRFDAVWCDRGLGNAWSTAAMLMTCSKPLLDNSTYVGTCLCWNGVDMGVHTTTTTYRSVVTDFTPPVCVIAGGVNGSFSATAPLRSTVFNVSWSCVDSQSGVVSLAWAMGYSNSSAEVFSGGLAGPSNGSTTMLNQTFLSAIGAAAATWAPTSGVRYYLRVTGTNAAGLTTTTYMPPLVVDVQPVTRTIQFCVAVDRYH